MDKPTHDLYSYPRTPHLDFSPGATSDDKYASKSTLAYLASGVELVVTEKLDGGNVSLYPDYFHARSLDSGTHAWDTVAKSRWAEVRSDIPAGWRISCESMYARRSVAYEGLLSPIYVIGIWNEKNELLSWDDTVEWSALIGLPTVPLIYRGTDYKEATTAWSKSYDTSISEGFVVRDSGTIHYDDFAKRVVKFVRADHVQTTASWRGRDDFALNTFVS